MKSALIMYNIECKHWKCATTLFSCKQKKIIELANVLNTAMVICMLHTFSVCTLIIRPLTSKVKDKHFLRFDWFGISLFTKKQSEKEFSWVNCRLSLIL